MMRERGRWPQTTPHLTITGGGPPNTVPPPVTVLSTLVPGPGGNAHDGAELSRRDDIESLFYVMLSPGVRRASQPPYLLPLMGA